MDDFPFLIQDITAGRLSDCSHALTCVAKVATAELATELAPDVVTLLASPRPYIRKKATLTLYSLVAASPDTLPAATVRLKDRLVDSDSAVVCAAVTVVAQLAARSPRPFLVLAPLLYRILTESHNNWLLIKVVKLFGVLAPLEPRLARKLAPPLTALMKSTKAKSLLYECCSTVTLALLGEAPLVVLTADNLGQFIMDPDQNLKYLGLASMRRLAARFPSVVMPHRGLVLDCLDDADVGIRLRALDLVGALVNRGTFREVSDVLLDHLEAVAAVAGRAAVSGLAGSGGGTEEDGVMGGGAGRHALTAIDTDAPFREALATRLLDAGVFMRPTAPPVTAGRPRTAPRSSDALPRAPTEGAVGQSPVSGAAAPSSLSPVVEPASSAGVEAAMSSISLADPAEDDAARNSTGGYLQLLTEDDFEWYVSEVLGGVARCSRCLSASVTRRAAAQLVELPARVPAARQSCVELALQLLRADRRGDRGGEDGAPATVPASRSAVAGDKAGDSGASGESASADGGDVDRTEVGGSTGSVAAAADDSPVAAVASVAKAAGSTATRATDASQASPSLLAAAAWLIGEYASLVPRPVAAVVDALLGAVPTGGGARCVSAALKLYASVATGDAEGGEGTAGDAAALHLLLLAALPELAASAVAEVQERSAVALALITAVPPGSANPGLLASLFGIPLLPVDSGAQARAVPAAAATAGVDLATPLLGFAERGRLIADADAAATVDAADRGLDGGRLAGGRRGAGEGGSTRGAETASLLSVGLGGGSLGGTTSRTSGTKPRRPRGERHRVADEAATLIDVHGDGGDGGGRRRAAAAAAILGDVGYDPAGDGATASASGAAAAGTTDDLYGELDFGIGGAVARGASPSASTSSTRPPGRTGGGKAAKAPRRTKTKPRAAPAAPADGDGVGQLVDFDDSSSATTKKPVRKKKVAKGTRAVKSPPPAAESLI